MDILNKNSPEVKDLIGILEDIADCVEYSVKNHVPHLTGERLLDNKEVCRFLNIKDRTLQEYRSKGIVSFYKVEGKIFYKESDIRKMLESNYYKAYDQ
ncbi:helix-turn-helix domain-containing protein [Dysgonomonas sp. ZJ279]|uniref:helix-turn-helix domain-containing protein n=1 Tax=Dysgonomonas sp. ZJ279 TaxID=2709796 RepID=UPI0013ECF0B0|nr:helix-turn-helix domain-containing protein [Dysgonomonas sp. ZJ279]